MRSPIVFLVFACLAISAPRRHAKFTVVEATIPQLQDALKDKRATSRELVEQYLLRIAMYNDKLHATIAVNPKALEEADKIDIERAQ